MSRRPGVNRVAGHTFAVLAAGTPVEMDQPACAYPPGTTQDEIERIYAEARHGYFSLSDLVGSVSVSVQWQALWWDDAVYIENARAFVVEGALDATVYVTFGSPSFESSVASLPVLFEVAPAHAVAAFVISATGEWRAE